MKLNTTDSEQRGAANHKVSHPWRHTKTRRFFHQNSRAGSAVPALRPLILENNGELLSATWQGGSGFQPSD
jgi:hypothetical protein